MKEKVSKNYLAEAPIPESYLKMALPVVAGMIISLVYNLVDIYFVSLTGKTEIIAGVSLCTPIFTMLIALGDIFGLGGSSAVSRLLGAGKKDHARSVSVLAGLAALLCGALVGILLLVLREPVLGLLGAKESTHEAASAYFTWIAAASPFVVFSFVPVNILRSEGKVKEAFWGGAIGSVANMILDPIMIFGLKLGAAGAALATFLGYLLETAYFVYVMTHKTEVVTLNPKYLFKKNTAKAATTAAKAEATAVAKPLATAEGAESIPEATPIGKDLLEILRIGLPACVTNLVQSLAVMLTNRRLLWYGDESVAGFGIASRAFMIASMVLIGFAFGGQPIIGYSFGSGDKKRLREIIRFEFCFEVVLSLAFTVLLLVASPLIMQLMAASDQVLKIGATMLRYMSTSLVFMAICLVATCIFQSVGQALGAFAVSVSRQGIIFALLLPLFSNLWKLKGILLTQPAADVFTALLAMGIFWVVLGKKLVKE